MPHVTIEYSANLEPALDVAGLVRAVHQSVLATGVVEIGGIRIRAIRCDHYAIGDLDPDNGFIHASSRIAPRGDQVRKDYGRALFDTICAFTAELYASRGLGISVEVLDIDTTAIFRKNNLHERASAAGQPSRAPA